MAFNPFEAFSIRSKLGRAVMAILGIVVMLTFVLSTGAVGTGNDFFDQIGSMFSSSSRGDVVAVAYDDDIHEADLREINQQRQAANLFLTSANDISYVNWAKELKATLEGTRVSNEIKQTVTPFVNLKANSMTDPRAYFAFLSNQQQLQRLVMPLVFTRPEAADDRRVADAVLAILAHDLVRPSKQPPPVFPDLDPDNEKDRLDFAVVLKKADRLGIKYSLDGVRELVNRETGGRLSKEDSGRIEMELRNAGRFGAFSGDWLLEAIGNEFRARDAYATLQGQSPITTFLRQQKSSLPRQILQFQQLPDINLPPLGGATSALPGTVTPYEFWEFYKDRCSEQTFSVLELSAEAYLDQVKGEPTPKERIELFNKYKGELPDPSKPTPGFKEPRKVKVEFTTLDATAPRIVQGIPKVQAASLFLCASSGAMSHEPVSALFAASQPGLVETLPIREAVSQRMQENQTPYLNIERWEFMPRDWAIFRERPIISALGMLAGNPDIASFVGAAAAVHQQVEVIDHQARIPFLLQPVLTPFTPTLGNAIGMPAFAFAHSPKTPSEGLYLAEIAAAHKKRQRQKVFQNDVEQLEKKLQELTKDSRPFSMKVDKAKAEQGREAARKHLTEWLTERGLTATGTPQPLDKFQIATAPELKPLNEKALPEPDGTNSLAERLFQSFDPRAMGLPGSSGLIYTVTPFEPFWFPSDPVGDAFDKPNNYVWISEEVAPMAYNSLDNANRLTNGDMTRRVDRAWKLEKARVLAKAEADRLAEEVRAIGKTAEANPDGVERQLKDLAAQKNLKKLELDRLAKLKFEHGATQAQVRYEPSKIDRKLIPFPTPNFADQLLELRTQPVGSVTVVADNPRTHYYVACLVNRYDRTIDQFRDVFTHANATGPAQNPLYYQYALPEERFRALEEVRARLRADAKLEETEAFKSGQRGEAE